VAGRRAVFLDRDGTINVEVNYLHRVADLTLIPGAPEAIARLNAAGFFVAVITNQAGIARGFYTEVELRALHEHVSDLLGAHGARVDAWYFCPHHPDFTGSCECRKPAPGMLLAAAEEHDLDLAQSWLVGDSAGDIGASIAAGCRTILVRTGYGAALEASWRAGIESSRPETVVDALPEAAAYILEAA
jgi:D-glycero-D-manno-heptose 1,7-bisphosphate phosphatase